MARLHVVLALSALLAQVAIAADSYCLVFTTEEIEDSKCSFDEHSCARQCVEAGFAITTTDVSDIDAVINYDSIDNWGSAQCCNCPQVLTTDVTVKNTQNCNTNEDCVLHYTYTLKNDTSKTCEAEVEVNTAQGGTCKTGEPKVCSGAPASMGAALTLVLAAAAGAMMLLAA